MTNVDNQIERAKARLTLLKNQKKQQKQRELEAKRKQDISRNIIVGGLVCKHFPNVMLLQPRRNNADNAVEFAVIENFLKALSANTEIFSQLKQESKKLELEEETG